MAALMERMSELLRRGGQTGGPAKLGDVRAYGTRAKGSRLAQDADPVSADRDWCRRRRRDDDGRDVQLLP